MKKYLLLLILPINGILMALPNDNIFENDRYDNILVDFDINYGRTFDNIPILNIKVFAPYASNNNVYLTAGWAATFSPNQNIFDFYAILGTTIYPFVKFFSFTFDLGLGFPSIFLLNHFSYTSSIKINIDIPIAQYQNITIGTGLQHRNAIKIFDYFNLNQNYYGIYNFYFFEIGYRIKINRNRA